MTRVNAITQTVNQIAVILLKFHEFQRFRSYLGTASGFNPTVCRHRSALLGKEKPKLQQYQGDEEAQRRLAAVSNRFPYGRRYAAT
ncbi:hypothetical protein M8494_20255 [Serratia ureilytica]